jgi:type IV pilus assembly protein PilW
VGFSLIELLVSMVIALAVTLAITAVLVRSEGSKRSTTSVNDIDQTGAYLAYVVDRSIRNAGSGFSQRWQETFGCAIDASKGGAAMLPLPAALSASAGFASVPLTVRLAPVLIGKGMADVGTDVRGDVLTVMGGTAGFGETPLAVKTSSVTSTQMQMDNTVGYAAGDLVLLADTGVATGCMVQQVATAASGVLTFGGDYYKAAGNISGLNVTNFGASTVSIQLGNNPGNPPQLVLYAVGNDHTLYTYDLLQPAAANTNPIPIANGVVEMRAVYGLDTTAAPDGTLDSWMDPVAGSGYTQADLTDGSAAAQLKLRRIVAIRLGFIMRTSLRERDVVTPSGTVLTLFSDLPAAMQQTRTISGDDTFFRFRTTEVTVPLRNVLLAPAS